MAGAAWRPRLWARASAETKERDPAPAPPATRARDSRRRRDLPSAGAEPRPQALVCPAPRGRRARALWVCARVGPSPALCPFSQGGGAGAFPPGRPPIVASLLFQVGFPDQKLRIAWGPLQMHVWGPPLQACLIGNRRRGSATCVCTHGAGEAVFETSLPPCPLPPGLRGHQHTCSLACLVAYARGGGGWAIRYPPPAH